MLEKIFPLSYRANSLGSLILYIIIYAILPAVLGFVLGIVAAIPVIGLLVGLVMGIIDLYCFVGIILAILVFLKVLK